jgi:DNA-binding NarL/FixJ family response regulator
MSSATHHADRGVQSRPLRLLIVEAQRLFRQSLRLLLEREPDIADVSEATDGREAYRLAQEHKPDIVLLDVDILDLDVESVTKLIHRHVPETKVLLLARYDEDTRIVASMQAGAFGYILKDTDQTDFLRIIRTAAQGKHLLSPKMSDRFVHNAPGSFRYPHEGDATRLSSLSDRERQILACAAAGQSNKEIADHLCVSVDTVKTHLHHIYQKLSVAGRVEAIIVFLRAQ